MIGVRLLCREVNPRLLRRRLREGVGVVLGKGDWRGHWRVRLPLGRVRLGILVCFSPFA